MRVVLVVALALVLTSSCGTAVAQAQGPLYVAASGSDSAACTQQAPCQTFARAYRVAALGATVYVRSGNYPAQTITRDPSKNVSGQRAHVVFRPAPHAAVTIANLQLGTHNSDPNGPAHLTIEGIRDDGLSAGCEWAIWDGSNDITLDHVSACSFYLNASTHIQITHSSFGPCTQGADPNPPCSDNHIDSSPNTNDVLLDGDTFHDIRIVPGSGNHMQCLSIFGGTNITVKNSRFVNCDFFDIFVQYASWSQTPSPFDGLLIEGNWFAQPYDGNGNLRDSAILLDSTAGYAFSHVTIKSNSFDQSTLLVEDQPSVSNFNVSGNIFGRQSCIPGIAYSHNLWSDGGQCGSADSSAAPFGYRLDGPRLTLQPAEAQVVRRIFALCAAGEKVARVAKTVGRIKVAFVRSTVANRAYLGKSFGATGAHPALISRTRFDKAQRFCGS